MEDQVKPIPTITVYIVTREYAYDHTDILAVLATECEADELAKEYANQFQHATIRVEEWALGEKHYIK